jgi:hypothetical protein
MIATAQCRCWCFPACGTAANRSICRTFLKRKGGLFKKAHELSVLCSVDVAVIIFGNNKKLYEYSSSDIGEILSRYHYVRSYPRTSTEHS